MGHELRLATRAIPAIDSVGERRWSDSVARRSGVSEYTSTNNPAYSILRLPSCLAAFNSKVQMHILRYYNTLRNTDTPPPSCSIAQVTVYPHPSILLVQ